MTPAGNLSGPAGLLDEAFGCFARGETAAAKEKFETVAALPEAPQQDRIQAHFQLGLLALAEANPARAAASFAEVHAREPDFPGLAKNYGKALVLAGEARAAIPILRDAGDDAESRVWLARSLARGGEPKTAAALFETILRGLDPDPEILCDFALALEGAGETERAARKFSEIRDRFPAFYDELLQEAERLRAGHYFPAAAALLKTAVRVAPDDPRKLHDLGIFFHELGLKDEAVGALKASLRFQPSAAAYGQLASLYEKANDLNQAWATATLALRRFPGDSYLDLTLARCERRAGKFSEAKARLERALGAADDPAIRVQIVYQLGWLYDESGETDRAFAAYGEAKRRSAELAKEAAFDPEIPIAFFRKAAEVDLNALPRVPFKSEEKGAARDVAFLLGFPRSGTTLLNQVLDAHPALVAIEEKPIVPHLALRLADWGLRYPEDLAILNPARVRELRADYFRLARDYVAFDATRILIDKLPLNIAHLPFILTLFPDAKIILALRHPLACALSCFTHNFRLNNAMVHMFSLDSIAALYAKVMGLWLDFSSRRSLSVHAVRYEDVVADLACEGKRLCAFLGVPFSPEMLRYDQHARAKGLINTPSYHQVVRPLYSDSVDRWRRYEKFLAPYGERLAPFTTAFGYDR